MSWQSAALGDLCDIEIGKTPSRAEPSYWRDGTLPWLSIADMNQGRRLASTKECITEAGARAANMKPVKPGTLLLSYKLSIGKVGIAQIPLYTNEAIAALSNLGGDVDPDFMYWALQHVDLLRGADRAAMGATLNKAKLKEIRFPVPPLTEQRRIAAILDKADALRAKRREAIAKLDQLLQSVFLEMFGDPVTNPKGWPSKHFGEICKNSFRNGLSPSTNGTVSDRVLTLSAITRGYFQSHHQKSASFDRAPSDNQRVTRRTFLICRGNGNRQLVGIGAFPDDDLFDVCFPDTMIGADIADHWVVPSFIELIWASRLVREQIESAATTTNGTFKINQKILEKIFIPIPPFELQARFEGVSTKLTALRTEMFVHAGIIDENFRSLLQRAFSGML